MPAQHRAQQMGQGRRVFCAVHFTLDAASTVLPSVANSGSFLSRSTEGFDLRFCFAVFFFSCGFVFDLGEPLGEAGRGKQTQAGGGTRPHKTGGVGVAGCPRLKQPCFSS